MFSGGIGVWLYDSGLGLSFSHVVPRGAPESDALAAEVSEHLLTAAHLGHDPRETAGLSHSETLLALRLSTEVQQGTTPRSLSALRERARALGVAAARRERPSLVPVCTAAPISAVVRRLGWASGSRAAPQGECSLKWEELEGAAFEMATVVPPNVHTRLVLPLALLRDAADASSSQCVAITASRNSASLWDAQLLFDVAAPPPGCEGIGAVENTRIHLCVGSGSTLAWDDVELTAREELVGQIRFGALSWEAGLSLRARRGGEYLLRTASCA